MRMRMRKGGIAAFSDALLMKWLTARRRGIDRGTELSHLPTTLRNLPKQELCELCRFKLFVWRVR